MFVLAYYNVVLYKEKISKYLKFLICMLVFVLVLL